MPKLATPLTAGTVVVPPRVLPPGLVPSAMVTLPTKPVTRFPWASRALTCTAGLMVRPATALLGCTVKASCVAAPAAILKSLLVPPLSPVAGAVAVSQ